jgi:ribosomal protein S18 acetylase RimI-like enzyme
MEYIIREIKEDEIPRLKDFCYEAIFQRDEDNLVSRDVLEQPELRVYYEDFGRPGDLCLVCEIDGRLVGAVWTRILDGEVKGFGNIDSDTPEFGISLYKEYRNKGLGTKLMKAMLELLSARGYRRTSLAVQKDNHAVKMYEKVGFFIERELEQEYLMICDLR